MATTPTLFYSFPREVANPLRYTIQNEKEFINFIEWNNGVHDCFTSVYNTAKVIDKIFFDFDGIPNSVAVALEMYGYCLENKMSVVPVASGKKGIHLYVLLKPRYYTKQQLYEHTSGLIVEVFGNKPPQELDLHPVGDIKRITRIPNTLRPPKNDSYCTYLDPDTFLFQSHVDVIAHCKSTHDYKYDTSKRIDLTSLPKAEIRLKNESSIAPPAESKITNNELKRYLRPCLYRHITSFNPIHAVRVAVAIDLLKLYSLSEIMKLFDSLNWRDWNPQITKQQIESCKTLRPYSCERLIELGIPEKCCEG